MLLHYSYPHDTLLPVCTLQIVHCSCIMYYLFSRCLCEDENGYSTLFSRGFYCLQCVGVKYTIIIFILEMPKFLYKNSYAAVTGSSTVTKKKGGEFPLYSALARCIWSSVSSAGLPSIGTCIYQS